MARNTELENAKHFEFSENSVMHETKIGGDVRKIGGEQNRNLHGRSECGKKRDDIFGRRQSRKKSLGWRSV